VANFFKRAAKYANASANAKLEARAKPEIQIQQAVEAAQKQHQALTRQAASVIGNVKSIEMKMARQLEEQGKARASAAQALQLADRARAGGDEVKAAQLEHTAQSFAGQMVSLDTSIDDLKHLHEQAVTQAASARAAVDTSADQLKAFLAQRSQLLTQLESAKMQEQVAASLQQVSQLSAPGDTPTLEQVRDKIESRYAQAIGTSELASSSLEAQQLEIDKASIDGQAALALEQIRASIGAGSSTGARTLAGTDVGAEAITAGSRPDLTKAPAEETDQA
jgi:phage shock protein A